MILHLWYRKVCFHFYFCEKTLIKEANVSVRLRPFFEAVFAFYFALALGTLGRMHDFICDMILGLNMQKTYVANRTALIDTAVLMIPWKFWLLTELQLLLWQLSAIKVTKERISRRKRSMRPGVQPDWTGMCYLEHGADEISRLHRLLFMFSSWNFVNESRLTENFATWFKM